jgi:7-keto-8-aminopelargonate synthetase-like enzyme
MDFKPTLSLQIVIIVEGIYSMEGEATPLAEIVALKKRCGRHLVCRCTGG